MEYVGNIIYDELLKKGNDKLVIWGAGKSGRKVYEYLCRNACAWNVDFFCDSDEALWGSKIEGVHIVDPMQVISSDKKYHFLVSGNYSNEIMSFLLKQGITRIHLLFM